MFSNHKQKQRKLDTPQISAGILQKLTAGSKAKSATENKIARTRTVWGDKTSNQAENNESSNPIKVGDIVIVVCDRGNERSRMQIFTRTGQFIKRIVIRYGYLKYVIL